MTSQLWFTSIYCHSKFFPSVTNNNTRLTINNNRLTFHSVFHHPGLQWYRSETHKSEASTSISYTPADAAQHSTCLTMSAKLICVRRWVWDEFISTGWENSSHMLGLLGTWEPYPYFPWGGSRCNPDWGMAALNGVKIRERYLQRLLRAHTHTHSQAEVHILNVTYFSLCYLVLW